MSGSKHTKPTKPTKHTKKFKKYNKLNCSPKKFKLGFTCYTPNGLHKLKHHWNIRHPDVLITSNDLREIWSTLKYNMEHVCSTEKCWLNQKFMQNKLNPELKHYTFAPNSPIKWKKNPNEWLNSLDLSRVMKQHEASHPHFRFIGPSPIDFDTKLDHGECVWNELCNFNLENHIKNNKTKIGIIFNTDPHHLGGAHWVCLFIDIDKEYIFYFDSNNDYTPREINVLAKRIIEQGQRHPLNLNFNYLKNKIQHQKTTSECGMYVLYVIIQLLSGNMTPHDFTNRIEDARVFALRKKYFN